jgi:hypothetical protein
MMWGLVAEIIEGESVPLKRVSLKLKLETGRVLSIHH